MRAANLKTDVLWAVAYKKGENPPDDFLVDEADALASFINTWVRKLYDQADFYDLVQIRSFTPDANHLVAYDQISLTDASFFGEHLWKILAVYLVDPRLNRVAISTPFRLRNDGIHVGFEHGPAVWIKYIGLPPQFSATQWNNAATYGLGDLTYSPVTGQSYKSKAANNLGNDPSTDSTNWEQVMFPLCLVDAVVRGVYADTLREEGQTDKGKEEEQGALGEQTNRATNQVAPGKDIITDQAVPKSRYKMA